MTERAGWTPPVPPQADEELEPVLAAAIAPVLRDLAVTGGPRPRIEDDRWGHEELQATGRLWSAGGRSGGVSIGRDSDAQQQAVEAADGVQEWAVEALWHGGLPTSWPACPAHPDSHPLRPELRDGAPSWCCPASGAVVAGIGALAPRG